MTFNFYSKYDLWKDTALEINMIKTGMYISLYLNYQYQSKSLNHLLIEVTNVTLLFNEAVALTVYAVSASTQFSFNKS